MQSRFHLLDRLAPVPAASRARELPVDTTMEQAEGWMSDIPRVSPSGAPRLTPARVALIRERVLSGVYHTRGYADDTARRILASGDL